MVYQLIFFPIKRPTVQNNPSVSNLSADCPWDYILTKMKSKLRNQIRFLVLILTLTFPPGLISQSIKNQYSSYPAYSTLPQEGVLSSSVVGSRSGVTDALSLQPSQSDVVSNGVEGSSEQNQKPHQSVRYYDPHPQGSHSMYYYQTFPAPKPQQRCTYTGNGMKCQHRRESPAGRVNSI